MRRNKLNNELKDLDWVTIILFFTLILMGWFTIYAAIYSPKVDSSMFDFSSNIAGKQFFWILLIISTSVSILLIDYRFWNAIPPIFYGLAILTLIAVLIFGVKVNGARAWFQIGAVKIQPAEFAKVATCLMLAFAFERLKIKVGLNQGTLIAIGIIVIPSILILLEKETGSVLVFSALIIMFYREGLHPIIPVLGFTLIFLFIGTFIIGPLYLSIGLFVLALLIIYKVKNNTEHILLTIAGLALGLIVVFGAKYSVENVLQSHQRNRIHAWFNPETYAKNEAYQTVQSLMAIGHGQFNGRGHLSGELTQMDQVPEQFTDFIFCTIGEEHGWVGTTLVIILYLAFLSRLVFVAERQKTRFARVYGYSVVSIFFFHFVINVGMTIGLFPVIGIPLPFFSYGGSSLLSFSFLVAILLKCDMQRSQLLGRD